MKNMKEHCADTKQIYGGEADPDDSGQPILLIKTALEEEESSSVVTCSIMCNGNIKFHGQSAYREDTQSKI
jgi:hypothetical protein